MIKRKLATCLTCLCLSTLLCACTSKTDTIMSDLYNAGYLQEYEKGEKIVKYDGVVPNKQVFYTYPIKDNEFNHVYRIYFDEDNSSNFKLYDYDKRIWYYFEVNSENQLVELSRNEF